MIGKRRGKAFAIQPHLTNIKYQIQQRLRTLASFHQLRQAMCAILFYLRSFENCLQTFALKLFHKRPRVAAGRIHLFHPVRGWLAMSPCGTTVGGGQGSWGRRGWPLPPAGWPGRRCRALSWPRTCRDRNSGSPPPPCPAAPSLCALGPGTDGNRPTAAESETTEIDECKWGYNRVLKLFNGVGISVGMIRSSAELLLRVQGELRWVRMILGNRYLHIKCKTWW